MAKRVKVKSKKKSSSRALNAFDLASRQLRSENGGESSDSDDGAIINPMKNRKNKDGDDSGSEKEFEDEEIDSDEALGDGDDYDVLNSKFSQTIRDLKKKKKNGEHIDDNEEEYDSVDESELIPLSAVWDLDEKDKSGSKDLVLDENQESESELESDDEGESENESESESEATSEADTEDSEDEDQNEEEFPFENVSSEDEIELTTLKNQLKAAEKKSSKKYENLSIEENELALPGGGADITLADMLSVVDSNSSSKAILIDKEDNEETSKALAVPLPKRIQQRNERKAAYEITKEEVSKWNDAVKQNRDAEVLSFPLNPTVKHNSVSTFTETFALTDLEKKVNSVLSESALLDEKNESKFEEIATAKMSPEELRKRQGELRKMRELMFRQEREAKRLKKIKSKSFRRIKKKELLKNQELIEGDETDDEDHDTRRAQERMSLKHKNNSKWAKSMIRSGISKDAEARGEMEEMLRRGERLRSKILDRDGSDDEFGDSNDLNLDKESDHGSDEEKVRENLGKTGVLNMAFMKNAESRERSDNSSIRSKLRQVNADEDLKAFEETEQNNKFNVQINTGRRVYTPGAIKSNENLEKIKKQVAEEHDIDQSKDLKNRLSKQHHNKGRILNKTVDTQEQTEEKPEEDSNPWLASDENFVQRSKKIKVVDQTSSKLEKTNAKLTKQKKRKASEAVDEGDDIIDMKQTLKVVTPHEEDHSEDDEGDIQMFQQKDLIKQAFAGDDVINEFEQEKKRVIKDEGDQVEDLTLPGWGDWAGGNKKQKKNRFVKVTKGVQLNDRKDKNKKNVIINEKMNKKNAKYQSSAVPFPFENREQYERSLRMPIGQEWTSRETHQRLTMPKVIAKSGVVIDPLKAPFK